MEREVEMEYFNLQNKVGKNYIKMRIENGIGNEHFFRTDFTSRKDISDNVIDINKIHQLIKESQSKFAQKVYLTLLDRNVEIRALRKIKRELKIGRTRQSIIYDILNSKEFKNKDKVVEEDVYEYLKNNKDRKKITLAIVWHKTLDKMFRFFYVNQLSNEIELLEEKFILLKDEYSKELNELNNRIIQCHELIIFQGKENNYKEEIEKLIALYNKKKELEAVALNNKKIELEEVLEVNGFTGEMDFSKYDKNEVNNKYEKFYLIFEELFRGDYNKILKQQSYYLKYLDFPNTKDSDIFLDLGCGRGEFLELLKKLAIHGRGVDANAYVIQNLQKKGFDVIQADIYKYLMTLENSTLLGISAFQVVEHLEFDYLEHLLEMSYQKIKEKGVLILETVNSWCTWGLGSYYLDPTHIKLYAPDMMEILLHQIGFRDIKIIYYAPISEELRIKTNILANYAGYAIVAYKN